ncbi:MAG TPA: sulfotransferase [Thermoanaerobaculia bacterium]|nr:sulfotransferase [Thermoanaerobaculia bacterium]
MPTNQQKAMFKTLMEALDRVEGLLHKVAESGESPALRQEAQTNLRSCRTIRHVAQGTFEEAERQAVGPVAAQTALAMEEIERRPRQDPQLRSRPAFIVGHARSGTTLLSWLLDSHANLAVVPENFLCHLLLDQDAPPEHEIYEQPIPIVRAGHSLESLGETRPAFLRRIALLIDGIFADYAARQGKKRWVGKELFVPRSLDLLDAVFGYNARFIYIVRHGLDSAFSASERYGWTRGTPLTRETSHNLRNYLQVWIKNNELYADFCELNPQRCLFVRYEDLVTNPEPVARGIFDFLGEPWQATIFEDMQRLEHHRHMGDNKILAEGGARIDPDRRQRWKSWPPALVRQLGRMADPTLVRLGYPPLAAGAEAPVLAAGPGGAPPHLGS